MITLDERTQYGVIVIDMQEFFLRDIAERKALIANQKAVLKVCAKQDIPVLIVSYAPLTADDLPAGTLEKLSGGYWKPIPEIKEVVADIPRASYFTKSSNSALSNAEVRKQLKSWNITDICTLGVNTATCITESVEDALGMGYRVHSAKTLITDRKFRPEPDYQVFNHRDARLYEHHSELIVNLLLV